MGTVALGDVHRRLRIRRHSLRHQCEERLVDLLRLGLDPQPVLLGVAGRARRRLLVGLGVAPALPGFVLVLGWVEVAENLELLFRCHVVSLVFGVECGVDGVDHALDASGLGREQLPLPA